MDHSVAAPPPARRTVNHKVTKLKKKRRKLDLKRSAALGLLDLSPNPINKRQFSNQLNKVTKNLGKLDLKTRLPKKYALLVEVFNSFEFCMKFLKGSGRVPTFLKLKPMIDALTERSFTYTDLAQLKFIFRDEIEIDSVLISNCWNDNKTPDLDITLKSDDFMIRKLFQQRLIAFYNSNPKDVDIPTPMVVIDQDTHPEATILHVTYGPFLLPDDIIHTMIITPLMDLGLDVSKQTPESQQQQQQTRLSIGRKVDDPDLLEHIKLTIISNLLKHPPPAAPELLLLDVVKRMADVNVNVESTKIDTC